jgi:hypothetical protein
MKSLNKKYGLLLLATAYCLLLLTVSCQSEKEYFGSEIPPGEVVEIQLSPALPGGVTPLSSDGGGAAALAGEYDLRYILEVWSTDATPRFVERRVEVASDYSTGVNFSVSLPAKKYNFVFWADFVTKGTTTDLTYNTENSDGNGNYLGLQDIEWNTSAYEISKDLRDAYYAVEEIDLTTSTVSRPVTLHRPFAKLRILATDLPNGANPPAKTLLEYTHASPGAATFSKSFNALTGFPNDATINASGELECVPVKEDVTVAGQEYHDVWLLAFDYFLVPNDLPAVSFKIKLFDAAGKSIAAKDLSGAPVGPNKLTTVIGPLSATGTEYAVIVGDAFDNDRYIDGSAVPVPSTLRHQVAVSSVTLSWKNVDVDSYEIDLNGTIYTAATNSKVIDNLEEATAYTWKVRAVKNGEYGRWSATVTFQTGDFPFIDKMAGNWGANDAVITFQAGTESMDLDALLNRNHPTGNVGVAIDNSGARPTATVTGMDDYIVGSKTSSTSFNIDKQLVDVPLTVNEATGSVSFTKTFTSENVYTANPGVKIGDITFLKSFVNSLNALFQGIVKNATITKVGMKVNKMTLTGTLENGALTNYSFVYDVEVVSIAASIDFSIASMTEADVISKIPSPQQLLSEVPMTKQ